MRKARRAVALAAAATLLLTCVRAMPAWADPGVTVTAAAPAGYPVLGIDVSSHDHANGSINWPVVAAGGVRFAYVKATEGKSYVNPYFAGDVSAAKAAGLLVGAYLFARPDLGDPVGQADYFLANAAWRDDPQTLVPFVDLEWPYSSLHLTSCWGLSTTAMRTWIHAFLDRLGSRIGRTPMIYTNTYWWNPCTGNDSTAGGSPLDVAAYTTSPPVLPSGWSSFAIWQYAAGNPATGTFDSDAFNGDMAALARLAGGPLPPVTAQSVSAPPIGSKAVLPVGGSPEYVGRAPDNTLSLWRFANGSTTVTSLGGSLAGDPAAIRLANGDVYVFGRTTTGTLMVWTQTGGVWSSTALGGSLAGQPVVSSAVANVPFVVGRGTDGTLWQWYFWGGQWYSRSLGQTFAGDPVLSGPPDTVPAVFARSTSGALRQWYYWDGRWYSRSLGGSLAGGPVPSAVHASAPTVFGRGTDGTLWQWYYWGAQWYSRSLGQTLGGDPTVTGPADGTPTVYARGAANALRQWYYWNGVWYSRSLGGSLVGAPVAAAVSGTGVPALFGRAADGSLGQWYYWNGGWYDRSLGGSLTEDPTAIGAVDATPWVFGRGATNSLQRWYYANSFWHTGDVGGALAP